MGAYEGMAAVYDELMRGDIDYERYCDFIEELFKERGRSPRLVADLACGTGNITIPLAKRGYDMTGVDGSAEMLMRAREKAEGLDILFLEQRLSALDLFGTMDAFICAVDGFNYILAPKTLEDIFRRIRTCFLDPEGMLIFDVSTAYKLEHIIGNETFVHDEGDVFYVWENAYHKNGSLSDMLLTFFVREKGKWRRFDERHVQRGYTQAEICLLLKRAGFGKVAAYDGLSGRPAHEKSPRIVFAAEP